MMMMIVMMFSQIEITIRHGLYKHTDLFRGLEETLKVGSGTLVDDEV
jgi:hypothetical protein